MTHIALVYFDARRGHRSAATSIQDAIQKSDFDASAELVNLQELLDPIDFIYRLTGVRVQDVCTTVCCEMAGPWAARS